MVNNYLASGQFIGINLFIPFSRLNTGVIYSRIAALNPKHFR